MKLSHTFLAVAGALALAAPASAGVTITFSENPDGNLFAESIAKPTVTGWDNSITAGRIGGTVLLIDFFATAPDPFSDTFSLLEPGTKNDISDQITFSNVATSPGSTALMIRFISDPADFITGATVYGSTAEKAVQPPIRLPTMLKELGGDHALTVTAQSDLDVPEPATWMLMLLGFGVTGLGLRRRVDAGYLKHLL